MLQVYGCISCEWRIKKKGKKGREQDATNYRFDLLSHVDAIFFLLMYDFQFTNGGLCRLFFQANSNMVAVPSRGFWGLYTFIS